MTLIISVPHGHNCPSRALKETRVNLIKVKIKDNIKQILIVKKREGYTIRLFIVDQ